MNTSRSIVPIITGWLCLFLAVFILACAALMFALQTPPQVCIGIGSTSLFPVLVAVACLLPSKRTLALRLIGAIVCVVCVATLVISFFTTLGDGEARPRRGMLVVVAIASGVMAIKGKWPSSDDRDEESREQRVTDEALK